MDVLAPMHRPVRKGSNQNGDDPSSEFRRGIRGEAAIRLNACFSIALTLQMHAKKMHFPLAGRIEGSMRRHALAAVIAVSVAATPVLAGTVKLLLHPPPEGARAVMLMTDGTVLAQGYTAVNWWKLAPDNKGS
jgi:hypothetical protein